MGEYKILLYNDENIIYKTGDMFNSEINTDFYELANGERIPTRTAFLNLAINNFEELNSIELDETTMRRIAKYNKEIEIKKIDEIIEEKIKKLEELEDTLNVKGKRFEKLKKCIVDIYDIDVEDKDDEWWD